MIYKDNEVKKKNYIIFVLFVVFLSIFLSLLSFFNYKNELTEQMKSEGRSLSELVARLSAGPLGEYDLPQLEEITDELISERNIVYVMFLDNDGELITQRPQFDKNIEVFSYMRVINDPARDNQIVGTVTIAVSAERIEESVERFAYSLLIQNVLFIISFIIGVQLFRKAIGRYERRILQSARLSSLGEVAASMAHEINNPLSIIEGELDLFELRASRSESKMDDIGQTIENQRFAIKRIVNIVKGIKHYSRFDAALVSDLLEFDVIENINKITSMISMRFEREGVRIEFDVCSNFRSVSPIVKGDEGKFYQIFMNLINNAKDAIRYANRQAGLIKVELDSTSRGIELRVSDNGTGIPKDVKERMFDPFYTTKPKGEGTGIGLDVVKSVVEEMGGVINLRTELGVGTSFVISLPVLRLEKVEQTSVSESNAFQVKTAPGAETLSALRVLVVEDEEIICEILTEFIEELGGVSKIAENGQVAYDILQEEQFDLVICDMQMPILTGEGLLKKLYADLGGKRPDYEFVLSTGELLEISEVHSRGPHYELVSDIILKPFSITNIVNLFDSVRKRKA